ncbi:hypothetical protein Tco_1494525, partial [Tanacetum coccineum]
MEMVASGWRWWRWGWWRIGVGGSVVMLDGVTAMMVVMMLMWLRGLGDDEGGDGLRRGGSR